MLNYNWRNSRHRWTLDHAHELKTLVTCIRKALTSAFYAETSKAFTSTVVRESVFRESHLLIF